MKSIVNATVVIGLVVTLMVGVFLFVCGISGQFNDADWGPFLPSVGVRSVVITLTGLVTMWFSYCLASKIGK